MQALIELLAGLVAMLAAAALSQFGLDLQGPQKGEREVQRVRDCPEAASSTLLASAPAERKRDC